MHTRKLSADAESPRTRQIRQGYENRAFPTAAAEVQVIPGLRGLEILVRTEKDVPGGIKARVLSRLLSSHAIRA